MLTRLRPTPSTPAHAPLLVLVALALPAWGGCAVGETEPAVAGRTEAVVYGDDDRLDYYESTSTLYKDITRHAVAAMIWSGDIAGAGPYTFADIPTLNEVAAGSPSMYGPLCPGERFGTQPTTGWCSGTLIDDDLLLTAGHCVDPDAWAGSGITDPCAEMSWVFDYYYVADGTLATMTSADVYGCAEVVTFVNDASLDFGIVRLDRPVDASRQPVRVRASDVPLDLGQRVTVIGFGTGLPAKIDEGGNVFAPRAASLDYFTASTDTFGGNSGSGVFTATGELVGILVRGATDYEDGGGCTQAVVMDESQASEDSTYSVNAIDALCATVVGEGSILCGAWCETCASAGDCTPGWSCLPDPSNPAQSLCQAPCASDADCRADHTCDLPAGNCVPEVALGCNAGDVWSLDACGTPVALVEDCGALSCIEGYCGTPPDGGPGTPTTRKGKGCSAAGPGAPTSSLPAFALLALAALGAARRRAHPRG